ncbi:hypothetical protein FRC11_007097, partial [Ceratobasidium sp. 423]
NKDKPTPIAPTVRFRDLSDHIKHSAGCAAAVARSEANRSAATEDDPSESVPGDVVDTWEVEAGFDEVIERPPPGSTTRFELPGSEEIDLTDPMLLDLLSDHPIPGALPQGTSSAMAPARLSSTEGKIPLVAESFTF